MKFFRILLFCLTAVLANAASPSPDALLLTQKLHLREFDRYLQPPSRIEPADLELIQARFGIDALITHIAIHFDASYSPAQIKGMLSLWEDPNMQLLIQELIGTKAPINQLLSKWTSDRQQFINQLRKDTSVSREQKK